MQGALRVIDNIPSASWLSLAASAPMVRSHTAATRSEALTAAIGDVAWEVRADLANCAVPCSLDAVALTTPTPTRRCCPTSDLPLLCSVSRHVFDYSFR